MGRETLDHPECVYTAKKETPYRHHSNICPLHCKEVTDKDVRIPLKIPLHINLHVYYTDIA